MGEIADMMLDGILCEGCGDLLGGSAGYPRRCSNCDMSPRTLRSAKRVVGREQQADRHNRERHEAAKQRKPFECRHCQKLFRTESGLGQHHRDKHGAAEAFGRKA